MAAGAAALLLYYAVLYFWWKWRLSTAVRKKGNIWYSERVSSPFVLGIMRPGIYLPYGLDPQEESYILLHEQTHIRHGDPLLHFVLRRNGPGMALAFGETHTEQRVRNILRPKRRGRRITLTVALAAAVGGMIFLTAPQGSRVEAEAAGDLTGQGGTLAGKSIAQSGAVMGEMREGSDVPEAGRNKIPGQLTGSSMAGVWYLQRGTPRGRIRKRLITWKAAGVFREWICGIRNGPCRTAGSGRCCAMRTAASGI